MEIIQFTIIENEPAFNFFVSIFLTLGMYLIPIISALRLLK
jgi:hypothetical protein